MSERPAHATRRRRGSALVAVVAVLAVLSPGPSFAQAGNQASGLVGTTARNTVTLSWLAPTAPLAPIIGYRLDVGFTPGATDAILPLGNVLSLTAVAPDGVFFVRVQALAAGGPTGPSNEVMLATGQSVPPAAPLSLQSSAVNTSVFLQWAVNPAGATVTGYVLEAGSGSGLANLANVPLSAPALSFAAVVPPAPITSGCGRPTRRASARHRTRSCWWCRPRSACRQAPRAGSPRRPRPGASRCSGHRRSPGARRLDIGSMSAAARDRPTSDRFHCHW